MILSLNFPFIGFFGKKIEKKEKYAKSSFGPVSFVSAFDLFFKDYNKRIRSNGKE
jgi:hypothetical protein